MTRRRKLTVKPKPKAKKKTTNENDKHPHLPVCQQEEAVPNSLSSCCEGGKEKTASGLHDSKETETVKKCDSVTTEKVVAKTKQQDVPTETIQTTLSNLKMDAGKSDNKVVNTLHDSSVTVCESENISAVTTENVVAKTQQLGDPKVQIHTTVSSPNLDSVTTEKKVVNELNDLSVTECESKSVASVTTEKCVKKRKRLGVPKKMRQTSITSCNLNSLTTDKKVVNTLHDASVTVCESESIAGVTTEEGDETVVCICTFRSPFCWVFSSVFSVVTPDIASGSETVTEAS